MSTRSFKDGDRVIVESKILGEKIPKEWSSSQRKAALVDRYYVTGEGPTCAGVRNSENTWRFNVPKDAVMQVRDAA